MRKNNYCKQLYFSLSRYRCLIILILIVSVTSCKEIPHKKEGILRISADSLLQIRYQKFLDYRIDSISIPRSYDPKTKKIIGIGIVGTNAGDMISEGCLAIEMGADAEDIGLTIHPHPTLSESISLSAEAFEGIITDLYIYFGPKAL